MSLAAIPQFSLGTAALIIFVVCAGFVMLRGVARMLVGTVVLALSAWVGFWVWQRVPALMTGWPGNPPTWVPIALPLAAFVAAFVSLRKVANFAASPFCKGGSPTSSLPTRLIFAFIPATLLCLIAATVAHHTSAVAEIRASANPSDHAAVAANQSLKSALESMMPSSWLSALDPLAEPARLKLAKLITAQSSANRPPVIDPATGQPIPRAIIVEDPELQNLAREGKFGTLLRHPQLTKALNDPKVQSLLKNRQL